MNNNFLNLDSLINLQLTDATEWNISEAIFNAAHLHHQETVFTIGNGYLGTRGTFEEGYLDENPATFIHGVYDDVAVVTTELVNVPNWLNLNITIAGETFQLDTGKIINYKRSLDMRLGLLSRDIRWRSPKGHTIDLHFQRFASLAEQHIVAIRCEITAIDAICDISVTTSLDENTTTQGIKHWQTINHKISNNIIGLHSRTINSGIQLGMATKLTLAEEIPGEIANNNSTPTSEKKLTKNFTCVPGKSISLEKITTIFTSRESENPLESAVEKLSTAPNFAHLLAAHIAAWEQVWQNSDIVIEGDIQAQLSVRFSLFQLLAATPRQDERVSIPPKTLSGYAYRGHIFWDTDIFIMPFLTFTQPQLARNLLAYRYHTLPGARRKALEAGYRGAMYAWESADTGDEVTPRWVETSTGEIVRIWCGDIEVHINTDVAYGVWQYWQATGDNDWMRSRGAEIILDTAVFWESRVEWNQERCGYDILDVVGPDENHDRVNNNAFTNIMVRWHLQTALQIWEWLTTNYPDTATELTQKLSLTDIRRDRWTEIAQRLFVNQDAETGLIEQFEGFFDLEDINLADYEPRTKSMQALLGIESTNQKQILKQPDVLMMLYLLRSVSPQVSSNLHYNHKTLLANWNYYHCRTDHSYGSSLGPAIHAILACELNQPEEAYNRFLQSALVDLADTRKNAHEGIHAATAGGVWQAVIFGFAGIRMTKFGPLACPNLPPSWQRLKFKLTWQNHDYEFDLTSADISQEPATNSLSLTVSQFQN
ncbi:glycoside hydrolase family 65 protein [Calothrix sp. UHCC 0171]|uniref:glycoside hydrolase family 65 protein n=1 Tax=Calothrix sp. UHCC 0171 TaxID=3110245 RepID=UPI002B215125|nr:glycoside hydrolase family 65 protein [Calothrix sp. UHCC 0171]MEA5573333.1 glycoside hydrolase family 65 protein [Calothrix sp. UHCC 0171]